MKLLDRNKLAQNIDIAAAYDFEHQKVFGSAYAVMQNDELLLKKYYGHTSAEQEKPVSEQTMFRLASMTKPVTAVAALILADRGTISLEDRVSKYLPEFEHIHVVEEDADGQLTDRGEASNPVLLRHLLTHTSGIGSSAGKLSQLPREVKANLDRSVCFFLEQGLDFEPGTKQQYSGFAAFDVLVKIIEQVTAADYEEFLRKEIFVPCGMDSTVFVPSEEQWERVIDMHNRVDGKCVKAVRKDNCIFEDFPCTHYLGGAGLVSTLEDYLKFAQMLLHQGKHRKDR